MDGPVSITRVNQERSVTVRRHDQRSDSTSGVTRDAQAIIDGLTPGPGVTVQRSRRVAAAVRSVRPAWRCARDRYSAGLLVMVLTFGSLFHPVRDHVLAAAGGYRLHRGPVYHGQTARYQRADRCVDAGRHRGHERYRAARPGGAAKASWDAAPDEALIQGGRTRVRPILMTAIATMIALMPLVLGFSEGSIIAAELGTVVVGGLFTSTFLTLIVVPVVYSLLDSIRTRLGGRTDDEDGMLIDDVEHESTLTNSNPAPVPTA